MNNFHILKAVCAAKNIPHTIIKHDRKNAIIVSNGTAQFISRYGSIGVFPSDRLFSARVTYSKDLTKVLLTNMGIKVPQGFTLSKSDVLDLENFITTHHLNFPVVLKPTNAARGKHVHIINSYDQIKSILHELTEADLKGDWLLEEFVVGPEYRILARKGVPILSYRKTPLSVVGDGVTTLKHLFIQAGVHPRIVESSLRHHNADADTISESEKTYPSLQPTNMSQGGNFTDLTNEFSEPLALWTKRIYQATGLAMCGVDLITNQSLSDVDQFTVLELNASPSISAAYTEFGLDFVYEKIWKPEMDDYFNAIND